MFPPKNPTGGKPRGYHRKPTASRDNAGRGADFRASNSEDKPRRSFGDKPRGNFSDRPRRDGDFGDKPRRAFGDKPRGNFSDRPRRDGDFGDKPRRAFGDKPRGNFSDRPRRDGDFGDKPRRAFGDKPRGNFSDRPRRDAGSDNARRDANFRDKPRRDRNPAYERDSDTPRVRRRGPWLDTAYSLSRPNVKPVGTRRERPVAPPAPKAPESPKSHDTSDVSDVSGAPVVSTEGMERLQKVMARAGVASRRNAELLILRGAVTVNGKVITELGTRVNAEKDKIKVDGKMIMTEVEPIYVALYKPKGVISSLSDPEGRQHLGHLLGKVRERILPIGRLDYNSEGLLLLTNDGDTAEKIQKARELPKVYLVKVKGHPSSEDLKFLQRGIFTPEGVVRVSAFNVEQSLKAKSWLKLEVTEGSRLDLRELLNHRGLLVDRIVRTAVGSISVKGLKPGEYRFMKRLEFEKLLTLAKTQ